MKKVWFPFVLSVLLLTVAFQSCKKDEMVKTEDVTLKSDASVINLIYPETDVTAGENFEITYSSACGKIMLERGYVLEFDPVSGTYNQVFVGLTCETENLLWESVLEDVFLTCSGETVTQNIEEPGTYVYRAKVNKKAIKDSECLDCGDFEGNQFECFMITVVAGNQNEGTFIDARDNHVYKWVRIGDQIWMAENLAFVIEGGVTYDDPAIYGRWYTWDQAVTACPAGWHLPSNAEWEALITYLNDNGYTCGGPYKIARALAAPDVWLRPWSTEGPGYPDCPANTSGFSALPAGYSVISFGKQTAWWSSDVVESPYQPHSWSYGLAIEGATLFKDFHPTTWSLSIRCIKNTD